MTPRPQGRFYNDMLHFGKFLLLRGMPLHCFPFMVQEGANALRLLPLM